MSVHGDHAEGEGGGEAKHQGEEGRDIAQHRPVREDPAVGENLAKRKLDKTCPIRTHRKCLHSLHPFLALARIFLLSLILKQEEFKR